MVITDWVMVLGDSQVVGAVVATVVVVSVVLLVDGVVKVANGAVDSRMDASLVDSFVASVLLAVAGALDIQAMKGFLVVVSVEEDWDFAGAAGNSTLETVLAESHQPVGSTRACSGPAGAPCWQCQVINSTCGGFN